MKVKYFNDTDTALIQFSSREVVETRELADDIYLDLDENGQVVSMTIEHAKAQAQFPELIYEEVG